MKILVTGATGFVGRHVVQRLLEQGHIVTALARNEEEARKFEWFNRVSFISCDTHHPVANPFRLFGQPDAVIHLAWPNLPNYKELFHFEENLSADYRFLKSLVEDGVKHLLVTGTCLEYGMQCGRLSEDIPVDPANAYALAKDTLRKFLQLLQLQHAFTLQWARLFYMYGEGQNPNSLLAQLNKAIEGGQPVFNMSGGEQLRDYMPVKEVAACLVSLVECPKCNGIVNVCSGKPVSVRSLVERYVAERNSNIKLNLGFYPYCDYEPMAFWGSNDRLSNWLKAGER